MFLLAFNPRSGWTPIQMFMANNEEAGNMDMETMKGIYELNPELLTAKDKYGSL